MSRTLIIGATSAIAEATARLLAERGGSLFLVGRNAQRLEAVAADLAVRGAAHVATETLDLNTFALHGPMIEHAFAALGGIDSVLIAHGTLSEQRACQGSVAQSLAEISTNALSVVSLLTLLGNRLEAERRGAIVVVSSVAGDRGRASNYVYGSAKALVTTFCSGLRQRLAGAGVRVITIKPGFVDTPMTRNFRKGVLWAQPDAIARGIVRAIDRGQGTVYLPAFWRPVMLAVRLIPERLFARMRL
ncbi:MAG: SDR family oxidoreductase [Gammaproteobacteria bacterium]|nr:SDR family oxidoreductase [Gammaproteobacteria bacterium]